jgi:PLP dependent protein
MTPIEAAVQANIATVRSQITALAQETNRKASGITLIAVSKTKPIDAIQAAFAAGQRVFGENYVQEAADKALQLAHLPIEWHFIGSLQSNKAKLVAQHMHWFHGVDRLSIAQALSRHCTESRPKALPALNVLIQVNISGEASKHGVAPDELLDLAQALLQLPGIALQGLMGMAQPTDDPQIQQREFALLRDSLQQLNTALALPAPLTVLSMGMSGDLPSAIACGATHVRVGTAIFGSREKT